VALFSAIMREIYTITTSATYKVLGRECDFNTIKTLTIQNFKESKWVIDEKSYHFQTAYWKCLLTYVRRFSPAGDTIQAILDEQETKVLKRMMVVSCGRKKAEQYQYRHRDYILDRMKELGLIAYK
jgi:hypothetical protein